MGGTPLVNSPWVLSPMKPEITFTQEAASVLTYRCEVHAQAKKVEARGRETQADGEIVGRRDATSAGSGAEKGGTVGGPTVQRRRQQPPQQQSLLLPRPEVCFTTLG